MTVPLKKTKLFSSPTELCTALGLNFSVEQLAAICAPLEPGVIIAGAGSGKTTVMAARVVWLIGTGLVAPSQVLGLTFTRKAASELGERIRTAIAQAEILSHDEEDSREVVMTYDSFAARLVAEHGLRMGIETDSTLITGATAYRLAAQVVATAKGPFKALAKLHLNTVVERLLKLDSALASNLVSTYEVRCHSERLLSTLSTTPRNNRGNIYASVVKAQTAAAERLELVDLIDQYQELKRHLGVMEFGDQLAIAAKLVREINFVPKTLKNQFAVVLLDEYQDTSAAQVELLRSLFGCGHPVTAVGDPFQAIYGWRGAAASSITSFAKEFHTVDGIAAKTYRLTVNRRSHQQILDVANAIGTKLRRDQATEKIQIAPLSAPKEKNQGQVMAASFHAANAEVDWVCESIASLTNDPEIIWSEIAILVRRNIDIPNFFIGLTERDIPVEIVGLGGLLNLPEIRLIVSTLTLLYDVTANADLIHLLTGPRWRIGSRDLAALGRRARELNGNKPRPSDLTNALCRLAAVEPELDRICLYDAILDPGNEGFSAEARTRFAVFVEEFGDLQRHAGDSVYELTRRVVEVLDLEVELAASRRSVRGDHAAQLTKFLNVVADYADIDGNASLGGLLAYLQAESDHGIGLEQAVPSEANSVKIMTVHRAKGLEWDRVYLPGLADKVFPNDRVSDNYLSSSAALPAPLRGDASSVPQLGEISDKGISKYADDLKNEQLKAEDRLAYVGVTRARKELIGSWHLHEPGLVRPRSASGYFQMIEQAATQQPLGIQTDQVTDPRVLSAELTSAPWPICDEAEDDERRRAADWVAEAMAGSLPQIPVSAESASLIREWDNEIEILCAELASQDDEIKVIIPRSLSVTNFAQLHSDPQTWAANTIRPMPQPPAGKALLGRRFHQWVQRHLEITSLFDDELGQETESDTQLQQLITAFEAGPYAQLSPHAVEIPFVLALGRHIVRGRIDAVYREHNDRWQIVDWKTSDKGLDPLQLSLYRLAWAQATDSPIDNVDAIFYLVRTAQVIRPELVTSKEALITLLDQSLG